MNRIPVPESCIVCGATGLEVLDTHAARCRSCGLLHNLEAEDVQYVDEGGQAVPDDAKMRWRLVNARRRLALIRPFMKNHELLVDVGCGSGEMLLAGSDAGLEVIGFDTNRPLIRHIREAHMLPAVEGHFTAAGLPAALSDRPKVYTLSHVLEHLEAPLEVVSEVVSAMSPGDLLYIEVPLATGQSFQQQGYGWSLWQAEHRALYTPQALAAIGTRVGLETLDSGARIFARGSHSNKTRLRLFRSAPWRVLCTLLSKPANLSLADVMIGDYGFVIFRHP